MHDMTLDRQSALAHAAKGSDRLQPTVNERVQQEQWMHALRPRLRVPVLVGVGAAFDVNSGRHRQAPRWMQEHGLEWLFRLLQEPRRLWRRYLVRGSEFLFLVALELFGLKNLTRLLRTKSSWPDDHHRTGTE